MNIISKKCCQLLRKKRSRQLFINMMHHFEPKSNLVTKLLGLFKKFFSNYFIL